VRERERDKIIEHHDCILIGWTALARPRLELRGAQCGVKRARLTSVPVDAKPIDRLGGFPTVGVVVD
jgi:hypothetical protein